MQKISLHRVILIIITTLVVVMGIMILVYPPSIFPDASHGLQVLHCMQLGGRFNILTEPDQTNIASNTATFLTWWSPGQYLIPYLWQSVIGINTGHATTLTIILAELSGLTGFYYFFKKIGFTPLISALSLAFIAAQQAFVIPFVFYNGGEVLLFSFEGWFLYGCISISKPGVKQLFFVVLVGWIGFFCKSSFIWMYFAGLLFIWLNMSRSKSIGDLIRNAMWVGVPAVISLACIYIFFLSKGSNPTAVSTGFKLSWQMLNFPLASPLLAGFSVDDLLRGLIFHPIGQGYSAGFIFLVLLILAILSLVLVLSIIRHIPIKEYKLLVMVFYITSIFFFGWVFLRQLNISYEGRHFRIIGLLLTPGVIYLAAKMRQSLRVLFTLISIGIFCSSYALFVKGYLFNKNVSARGTSGIAQEYIDQQSLDYVMQLDRQQKNAIFAFTSVELGMEINHNRSLTLDIPDPKLKFDIDDYSYDGHAGPLYIILPASFEGERGNMVTRFFSDYSGFSMKRLSPKYIMYTAQ